MKKLIKQGYTNTSYYDSGIFYQEKNVNNFNHRIDYRMLKVFEFVPQLIEAQAKTLKWEWIPNTQHFSVTIPRLKTVAAYMKTIHNSQLKFPPTTHKQRINTYYQGMRKKGIIIPELEANLGFINSILDTTAQTDPTHNSLWKTNILVDNQEAIFIIDFEYACLGNKHYDLAFFIEITRLNELEEKIFLNAYADYDRVLLLKYKAVVHALVITWVNFQTTKHFDETWFKQRLVKWISLLKKLENK